MSNGYEKILQIRRSAPNLVSQGITTVVIARSLDQLDAYLATLELSRGVLVIFDARADAAPVEDRTRFEEAVTASGRKVTVLHQGSVLCEGAVDEVQNNERVIEVYLGRKQRHH